MDAEKQNAPAHPHANHRERVRRLFLQSGLDGFSDHNVLELLLFYTIPQGDTNITAHNLIDRFGSLKGVLDASPEELCSVKGLGMYTATFLSILPQLARRYCAQTRPNEDPKQNDADSIAQYLRARFVGERNECVFLLAFGSSGQKLGCVRVTSGASVKVLFDERTILEAAFRTGAASVILAHNHPGGVAAPSQDDIEATRQISQMFSRFGIALSDHVIIAGEESFSMAAHHRYQNLFIT